MKRIAKFEKVSFEQFEKDFKDCYPESKADVKAVYDYILRQNSKAFLLKSGHSAHF